VFYRNLDDTNPARLLDNDTLLEIEAYPITTVAAVAHRRCGILQERRQASPGSAERILAETCRRYLQECEDLLEEVMQKHAPGATGAEMNSGAGSTGQTSQLPPPHKDDDSAAEESDSKSLRQQLGHYFTRSFNISLREYNREPPLPWPTLYEVLMKRPFPADVTDERVFVQNGTYMGSYPRESVVQPLAGSIAEEFDGYVFFVCEDHYADFCRSTSVAPQPGDMVCLLRGSTKLYILRPVAGTDQWTMIGTTYMDAEFSHDWHRDGTGENEMRRLWAAGWRINKEKGKVRKVVIR